MFHERAEPDYVVSAKLENDIEIREYPPQIWATALAASGSGAFRALAAYVYGDNDRQEIIGMTAPVILAGDRMVFVMPGRYNLENLPRPLDGRIGIESAGPRKLAVITFAGFADPQERERNQGLLKSTLERHGIRTRGTAFLMRYDPPWTPPILRRNEIGLQICQEEAMEKEQDRKRGIS